MFISGNPATVKLFGAKNEEEFISLGSWELSPERQPDGRASAEKSQEMIATAVRAGSHYFEWTHRRIGGEEFPADVLLTRMEQGGKVIVQATVRDITARKAGERHLREQNDILTNSHEGVMIVNLANEISLWNCGAEALFGWTAAEALGRPPEKVLGVDDLGGMSTLRAAVERDGFWNGELRSQTRDGRQLIVDCRITLVRDEAGRPRAQLSFLADITAEKLLEEKFLHVQRLENLGMLAAGIAHDFNNALAPIVMAGQLLHQYVSDPVAQHLLGTVEKSAERSVALVRQLLSFARGASGHSQLLQVRHVLHEVIELAEATFPKSIRVESDLPGDLWPVQGSPTQIHQIFLNLCVNARDAMPEGGELTLTAANCKLDATAAAQIAEARPGAFLKVEVRDTGTGIPPEVLAQIWEPFFTTKGEGKGTGLGLSTVRGILHQHAGFVSVQTQTGHGTAFTVYLPAAVDGEVARAAAAPAELPRGNGELILVVDDEKLVCELTAQTLIGHGYRVVTACDGADAIAVFVPRAAEVRLLLTDLQMPLLSGPSLVEALRRLQPGLRVVAMSGVASRSSRAYQKFTTAFLAKPFQPETLLAIVRRSLDEDPPPTAPRPVP
jgi:PAS domain S-box-containing protein